MHNPIAQIHKWDPIKKQQVHTFLYVKFVDVSKWLILNMVFIWMLGRSEQKTLYTVNALQIINVLFLYQDITMDVKNERVKPK